MHPAFLSLINNYVNYNYVNLKPKAAVNSDDLTGDKIGSVAAEKRGELCHILRLAETAQGSAVD